MSFFTHNIPGHSGTFAGHFEAGVGFFLFGLCFLVLSLFRARNLPPNKTFAETHIPEKNYALMRRLGRCALVLTSLIIFIEVVWFVPFLNTESIGNQSIEHLVLAFSFWFTGLIAVFEADGKVPPDSHRQAMALVFGVISIMFYYHSLIKEREEDVIFHLFWGFTQFLTAVVKTYSVHNPQSTPAFILGWLLVFFQGIWIFTIGFYACCFEVMPHMVATYWCIEALVLSVTTILISVYWGVPYDQQANNPGMPLQSKSEFSPLSTNDDEVDSLS